MHFPFSDSKFLIGFYLYKIQKPLLKTNSNLYKLLCLRFFPFVLHTTLTTTDMGIA